VEAIRYVINGCVVASTLSENYWTDVCLVLSVIQEKLNNPSPEDPFDPDIAAVHPVSFSLAGLLFTEIAIQILKNDKAKFLATAKEHTKK